MTYAGISHLTIARQEFVAQVPAFLPLLGIVAYYLPNIKERRP